MKTQTHFRTFMVFHNSFVELEGPATYLSRLSDVSGVCIESFSTRL